MVDEHDTISRYDTHESDKSYEVSRRYDSSCEPYSENTSEPSCDNTEEYLKDEDNVPEMPIEDTKESEKYTNRNKHEKFG